MPLEDLVLMPEVDARRALAGSVVRLTVLAPLGSYAGCGTLRVLRARPEANSAADCTSLLRVDLVCGYEAYERIA